MSYESRHEPPVEAIAELARQELRNGRYLIIDVIRIGHSELCRLSTGRTDEEVPRRGIWLNRFVIDAVIDALERFRARDYEGAQ